MQALIALSFEPLTSLVKHFFFFWTASHSDQQGEQTSNMAANKRIMKVSIASSVTSLNNK